MTNDEIVCFGSAKIRTVGEFIAVDEAFLGALQEKTVFVSHQITVLNRMKAAKSQLK